MIILAFAKLSEYIIPSYPFQVKLVVPSHRNSGANVKFAKEGVIISCQGCTGVPDNLSIPWFGR